MFDENQMNVSAVPPAEPGDSQRRLHASRGSQTGGQDPLSKFASLLDPTSPVPTWTSLTKVAQPIENVSAPASEEATRPSNIVPLAVSKETNDNPTETVACHSGVPPTRDRPEPSRRSRGWKPKAFALASLFLIGTAVALSWRDHVRGLAETYRSMLVEAIAGLDDAPILRPNAMPERAAQPPSEDTLSTVRATPVAGNAHSARDRADKAASSEEQTGDASAPARTVARASGVTAPADVGARPSGASATPSTANPVQVTDNAQSAHPGAESYEEQAIDTTPPAGIVVPAPGPTAPADMSSPSVKSAIESATPSAVDAVPVTDNGQSAHPGMESYEEQATKASPPVGIVAPGPALSSPADVGATKSPLAPRLAVAPVRVGSAIPESKAVRIISVRPDGTLISSAIGSSETSPAADASKLPAKPASEGAEGSAGIAPGSNQSSDLPNTLDGKPGIAATPNDVARMPSRLSKPENRHKGEKSEKSANAVKVNAAETDANASAIQSESSGSDQAPANTPTSAHAGRL
jgi:hypothetical protein